MLTPIIQVDSNVLKFYKRQSKVYEGRVRSNDVGKRVESGSNLEVK